MSTYEQLLAERFGPSLWWVTPERTVDEVDAAHARKVLLGAAFPDTVAAVVRAAGSAA